MEKNKNLKEAQLKQHTTQGEESLTSDQGVRVSDNQNSLKAGDRGPVLLEDFLFR